MERKPLVVHIISGDLWAGAEVQAFSLIQGLLATGSWDQAAIIFNSGMLEQKLTSIRVPVWICDESTHNLATLIAMCFRALGSFKPQIVHAHGFKENFVGGIAARMRGIEPVIRTHHGQGMIGSSKRHDVIEHFNARFLTDAIISVSSELAGFLIDLKIPPEKINVVRNGIDASMPVPLELGDVIRKKLDIPEDAPIIGTVGRLVPIKDHNTMLDAAHLILAHNPDVYFVLVGDGPLYQELADRAKKLGIYTRVRFTGFQKNAIDIMRTFDIFILSSLHEGIPMVLLEAMALGKPIVASRVGGIAEIIENQVTGILISQADSSSLAGACLNLLEDNSLQKSLSTRAKEAVNVQYSISITAANTAELYRRAMTS